MTRYRIRPAAAAYRRQGIVYAFSPSMARHIRNQLQLHTGMKWHIRQENTPD